MISYAISLILIFNIETWIGTWIILELNTLTFIGFLLTKTKRRNLETAISYFLVQTIRSLIFITSLYFALIFNQIIAPRLLFLMAIIVKLAASPTHTWIIPVIASAPWLLCWLILTAQKIFPLLLLEIFHPEWQIIVVFILISTLLIGSLPNLSSNTLKIIVIFSRISTARWTYMALTINRNLWKIYFIIYSGTLLLIISEPKKKSNNNIILITIWLRMAGIPPFVGFLPKLIIITDLIHNTISLLILLFLTMSILDTFIYFRLTHVRMLKEKRRPLLESPALSRQWKTWLIFNRLIIRIVL